MWRFCASNICFNMCCFYSSRPCMSWINWVRLISYSSRPKRLNHPKLTHVSSNIHFNLPCFYSVAFLGHFLAFCEELVLRDLRYCHLAPAVHQSTLRRFYNENSASQEIGIRWKSQVWNPIHLTCGTDDTLRIEHTHAFFSRSNSFLLRQQQNCTPELSTDESVLAEINLCSPEMLLLSTLGCHRGE